MRQQPLGYECEKVIGFTPPQRRAFLGFPISAERRLCQRAASRREGLARQDSPPLVKRMRVLFGFPDSEAHQAGEGAKAPPFQGGVVGGNTGLRSP
jgi:hypothetical protein